MLALLSTFGLAFAAAPQAAAQEDAGSLVIGLSTCPQGYDGEDFAADCDDLPAVPVDFVIGTPHTGNTETTTSRADGLVTFSLAPYDLDPTGPDTVSVGEPAAQALDYAVFCTKNGGEALEFSYETIESAPAGPLFGITFEIETGDQVACEWYNIPQPMNPGDDDDGDQVGQLPNTGVGTSATAGSDQRATLASLSLASLLIGGLAFRLRRRTAA
jgi:hypothetical protein